MSHYNQNYSVRLQPFFGMCKFLSGRKSFYNKNLCDNFQPSTSGYLSSNARKVTEPTTKAKSLKSEDFNSLWDDELENAVPPSNSSSFYGVSDISNNDKSDKEPSLPSSSDRVHMKMALSSSEDESDSIKDLLDELHVGDVIPVRVSDINSPLKFWVHIRQDKYIQQINKLYKAMA